MGIKNLFKNHTLKKYLVYSVIAAVAYLIIAGIFISYGSFTLMWLLYIGNMLFALSITIFILMYNKKRRENANTGIMISAGLITTIMGVMLVCAIILVSYIVAPALYNSVPKGATAFLKAPPQMKGRGDSFIFNILVNAVVGNVSTGSFISVILPYAAKRNQKEETPVNKS
jgi:magnesium-transporting ATPase (P-type)